MGASRVESELGMAGAHPDEETAAIPTEGGVGLDQT